MVSYEIIEKDGRKYVRAYSTTGLPIQRYIGSKVLRLMEAIDPYGTDRYYEEVTNEPIEEMLPIEEPPEEEQKLQRKYVLSEEQYNSLLERIEIAETQTSMKINEVAELSQILNMLLGLEV